MRTTSLLATACMTLLIGAAFAPAAAATEARQSGRGGRGAVSGGGSPGSHRQGIKAQHDFKGRGGFKAHDGFAHRRDSRALPWVSVLVPPFYGYGFGAQLYYSPQAYYPPPTYYPPPVYYNAPTYYGPGYAAPAAYAAPVGTVSVARTPPVASVVEHPNGRFELVGDGMADPYTWVWIPNPPPPPPAAPPAPAIEPAASRDESPARRTPLYRWTDEQGVVHWSNRPEAVPARGRVEASHTPPS